MEMSDGARISTQALLDSSRDILTGCAAGRGHPKGREVKSSEPVADVASGFLLPCSISASPMLFSPSIRS